MTTIGNLMDRLVRQILYPPDYEPPMFQLSAPLDDTAESFNIEGFQVPEDVELVRQGILLELDQELIRVLTFDGENAVTGKRAQLGTTATAHTTDIFGIMAPSFTRLSIFQAVRDNIVDLYPSLFTVSQDNLTSVQGNVAGIPDPLAVEVLTIWPGELSSTHEIEGRIVDFHPSVGGRALVTNVIHGQVWLRYKRRMGVAETEADLLTDLGIEESWGMVVIAGAAADLFVGRDIPAAAVEWVSGVLAAENVPVGTRTSVAGSLAQYRDILLDRYKKEMTAEYRPRVRMRNASGRSTGRRVG